MCTCVVASGLLRRITCGGGGSRRAANRWPAGHVADSERRALLFAAIGESRRLASASMVAFRSEFTFTRQDRLRVYDATNSEFLA